MNSTCPLLSQVAPHVWIFQCSKYTMCIFPETKNVVFTIEEIVDFPLEHSSKSDILFSKWHFSHLATYKRRLYDPEIHRCVHDILVSLGATCQTIYLACNILRSFTSIFNLSHLYEHEYSQLQLLPKRSVFSPCCPNHLPPIHNISSNCFPPFSPRNYLAKW